MKVFLLNVDYYYENIEENDYETEVYLSLERATAEGKYLLSKRCKDKGFRDYNFTVTETNPEYAENFNSDDLSLDIFHKEDYGMYEPTHIIYTFDIEGNLQNKYLEYRDKQRKHKTGFTVFPEDENRTAGQKFKIGDVVKVKARDMEEYYQSAYMDSWNKDKLYVVRWLPRRKDGQKYFENTYALISNYNEDEYMRGLFTSEHYERDIELFDGKLDENSPIIFLQKIIKNEIAVSKDTWTKLKTGQVLLDDAGTFRKLKEFKDGDSWSWYSNTISKEDTDLAADLIISFGIFYAPIKDYLPKIRIHASSNYEDDFYVTIEEQPKIIIGRNTLLTEESQKIYTYIAEHLDTFLEFWYNNGKQDAKDLYMKLGLYDKEQKQMEEELFTRSTISPRESGLETNIYLMCNGQKSIWAPEPKVKIQIKDKEITILLEPNVRPSNIEQYNKLEPDNKANVDNAIKYIEKNKDIILKYWNGEFEEYELHNILKSKE